MTETNETNRLPCGHPRGCDDGTGCAWCEEVARLRKALAKQIHKRRAAVASVLKERSETEDQILEWNVECDEGVAQMREELERLRGHDGHPHESGDECIGCERLATERGWLYCDQCFLEGQLEFCDDIVTEALAERERSWEEIKRLRMIVDQDGAAYLPCQHCHRNVATPTLESVELCFECWERLRELIPDAGRLDWLVKAAHRWWKDNGGEGTQKDIEAGYALVKELYREATVGET